MHDRNRDDAAPALTDFRGLPHFATAVRPSPTNPVCTDDTQPGIRLIGMLGVPPQSGKPA